MGINLSAIDIIIDISCTGIFITFKKPMLFSRPSVSALGVVVKVITDDPTIRKINLSPMNIEILIPSLVILIIHSLNTTSPSVKNRLKLTLIIKSIRTAFSPFTINFTGTFESEIATTKKSVAKAYPGHEFAINRETIKIMVPKSFVLGSSLCITESIG